MNKVILVSGHGPLKDRGAEGSGTTELDWNRDLVKRIAEYLPDQHVIVHRTEEGRSPVTAINESGGVIVVEFHLNASDGNATGTEMIYHPSSVEGRRLAEALQRAAVTVLRLRDRRAKEPWAGRGMAFLRGTRMPAVICESGFIDNPGDIKRLNEVKEALAMAYAHTLKKFL